MEAIRKITLPNGVRLLFERIPSVRSASVGLWIDVGSRNETEPENGLSHFIEHMFFKGTRRRNAYELSNAIDLIGGNVNAFTTHENIVLSAKVIDEQLCSAIDLIAELYLESAFPDDEIARERNVVLEEVKMYNDAPDELVIDHFMNRLYADHALGRPILGSPDRIAGFDHQQIDRFTHREFAPDRLVVSIAGNFDLRRVEPRLRRVFEPLTPNGWERNRLTPPTPAYLSFNEDRRLEQVHFCMGTDAPNRTNPDRFAFAILNTILGGGTSSRIFQEVRERRGLAYNIGTFEYSFRDAGCFAVAGGSSPRNAEKVVRICLEEIRRICDEPVSEEELESAKQQLKSSIILGMENSANRMSRLAECEMFHGQHVPVDQVVGRVAAVTAEDVLTVARKYLRERPVSFASIGPEKKFTPFLAGMTF